MSKRCHLTLHPLGIYRCFEHVDHCIRTTGGEQSLGLQLLRESKQKNYMDVWMRAYGMIMPMSTSDTEVNARFYQTQGHIN